MSCYFVIIGVERGRTMNDSYINLTKDNLETEHICCAIADKKHKNGVDVKKKWLSSRIEEGHVFRKLDERGKVFIEYAPLENAWVPVCGDNYMYIYCLWVAGSFKGQGHGKALLEYCIKDAKKQKKSGVCILSSKKKISYLSDKKFMLHYGFEVVDTVTDYELLALSFDKTKPSFMKNAKTMTIKEKELTIYYGIQCPFIPRCIDEVKTYCDENHIPLKLIPVDTLDKAKKVPCVFTNWALFQDGQFVSTLLMNEGIIRKLFGK